MDLKCAEKRGRVRAQLHATPAAKAGIILLLSAVWLATALIPPDRALAQGRHAGGRAGQRVSAKKPSAGGVYPEFRRADGRNNHWIKEQMPLRVYVSHGQAIDGFIDEQLGAPIANTSNVAGWPTLVAQILNTPGQIQNLPAAQGYSEQHYAAALQGINSWKPLEQEGLFSYQLVNEPDADIFVFWVHHFVDKTGMGLFAGDIRGYTSMDVFPYQQIMAGAKADFKPVVIMLRTTEGNGAPMPLNKMRASAAHEFGHALGIANHSRNPADLMSLYYGYGVVSANDAATMRYLYHLPPDLIP